MVIREDFIYFGHRSSVQVIKIIVDNQLLVSCDSSGCIIVWDIKSGQQLESWICGDGRSISSVHCIRNHVQSDASNNDVSIPSNDLTTTLVHTKSGLLSVYRMGKCIKVFDLSSTSSKVIKQCAGFCPMIFCGSSNYNEITTIYAADVEGSIDQGLVVSKLNLQDLELVFIKAIIFADNESGNSTTDQQKLGLITCTAYISSSDLSDIVIVGHESGHLSVVLDRQVAAIIPPSFEEPIMQVVAISYKSSNDDNIKGALIVSVFSLSASYHLLRHDCLINSDNTVRIVASYQTSVPYASRIAVTQEQALDSMLLFVGTQSGKFKIYESVCHTADTGNVEDSNIEEGDAFIKLFVHKLNFSNAQLQSSLLAQASNRNGNSSSDLRQYGHVLGEWHKLSLLVNDACDNVDTGVCLFVGTEDGLITRWRVTRNAQNIPSR
ncbi:hypothetical protein MIR68_001925 [Amoeboaphelidium protococcarum]|nr:hypothetical protein MIR68_001925 [Amoeboaphelidium protococcarum]